MGGFCWQRIKDSNPDKQIQNLSCYLYTNPLYALFSRRINYYTQLFQDVKSFLIKIAK